MDGKATAAVRHCPESSSVVLWSSQPSRSMPGPLPSSEGLHCGHSCRLETKAWPSQTIVAQNGGDRPASTESWPGEKRRRQDRVAWRRLVATATSTLTLLSKLDKRQKEDPAKTLAISKGVYNVIDVNWNLSSVKLHPNSVLSERTEVVVIVVVVAMTSPSGGAYMGGAWEGQTVIF